MGLNHAGKTIEPVSNLRVCPTFCLLSSCLRLGASFWKTVKKKKDHWIPILNLNKTFRQHLNGHWWVLWGTSLFQVISSFEETLFCGKVTLDLESDRLEFKPCLCRFSAVYV